MTNDNKVRCPCGHEAVWVENKEIYGKNIGESWMCYLCKICGNYVGCHQNTRTPLGKLADEETRLMRREIHKIIDRWWRSKSKTRREVYRDMEDRFGKPFHVGDLDKDMARKILEKLKSDKL